jgi:hypothetical protein
MLEESPPIAMTAYTAESRGACDCIMITLHVPGAIQYIYILDEPRGHSFRLLELADAMLSSYEIHSGPRILGRVKDSDRVYAGIRHGYINGERDPDCNILYDYAEFMCALESINMGEVTAIFTGSDTDRDRSISWATDTDSDPSLQWDTEPEELISD